MHKKSVRSLVMILVVLIVYLFTNINVYAANPLSQVKKRTFGEYKVNSGVNHNQTSSNTGYSDKENDPPNANYDLYFNIKNDDSILISRPLFHCAVMVGEFFISLVKGVKIHFYSDNFNPFTYAELIKEKNITIFCGTPTMMRAFSRLRKKTTSLPLKNIAISGEYMSDETATKLKKAFPYANIYYVYGLTEASPRVAYLPPENFGEGKLSVGRPLKSVKIKILKQAFYG